ncbi:hypothetical protein FACHB389_20930 [Nostoc calcicola FACHB-389]|nr:hypothetical protein FACHB389_20930 [Nostoc calcicola FACHB-389]
MISRYSMIIQWSDEDQLFLVTIPEFSDRLISEEVIEILYNFSHNNCSTVMNILPSFFGN